MTPDEIRDKYKGSILQIMDEIRKACEEEKLYVTTTDEINTGDDSSRWYISVYRKRRDDLEASVDVTFLICCSEDWDGKENGVNFAVDIVSYGGHVIGGLTPYNYTADVWVSRDNPEAIDERFSLMQQADVSGIPDMIWRFFNAH